MCWTQPLAASKPEEPIQNWKGQAGGYLKGKCLQEEHEGVPPDTGICSRQGPKENGCVEAGQQGVHIGILGLLLMQPAEHALQ